MTGTIDKVAVIGSGVMGAGIAAHCANAGCEVLLLDIVPEENQDRSAVARNAIQMMHKSNPEMLMHKRNAKRITPGNIEDDLHLLEDYDWVVEVIIENLEIKRNLYSKLSDYIGPSTILSSNTSTIPRSELVSELPEDISSRFLITHFFNPPRYLPLLEVVTSSEVNDDVVSRFCNFADRRLGKRVTMCNDRPGFIGNRLGVYFVQRAIKATLEHGLSVEQADAMLGRPIGLPKTGVFALMDLIGIDLIPKVGESLRSRLDQEDPFHKITGPGEDIIMSMIEEGYTGRKGKGGFYRLNRDDGKKVKEARDLSSGEYRKANRRAAFPSAKMGKRGLSALMDCDDDGARFVTDVLLDALAYAAFIVPDVCDDIYSIDGAMKVGYNWKKGPFEMMDSIGVPSMVKRLQETGREVPKFLSQAEEKGSFYSIEEGEIMRLSSSGEMVVVERPEETLNVADLKRRGKPLKRNGSASIWDMGDEVLLVEYHTKMNAMDPMNIEMLVNAVDIAESDGFKGIVIGNDASNFCAGANLGLALFAANLGAWKDLEDFITLGQDTYQTLKYCDVPVVAASAGLCLGGGAEVLMHCDAVQAHAESYVGLVEVGVGVVPAWGGCKELLGRLVEYGLVTNGPMGAAMKAFETIGTAQVAKSAEQASSLGFLAPSDQITMNRDRLLADAKTKVLELHEDYTPPEPRTYALPGPTGMAALSLALNDLSLSGQATPHDVVVATKLARILTGGDSDITETLEEDDILSMEKDTFANLLKNLDTLDRVQHMLETGKPLRN
ncbi:MAG TPA: 3-hydroxyacyl-CoA dehydrogenase/enoyl-CoA hydratase family protein [Candidatus Thalassarchaeaceae archaeon]|nr:MAG TPA: 3-hydroxyacyl-CoA dehydrogenase/enoyl-CoA hydratase family protein [Candidatus Poseidoniales archaeon]HII28676.1 3-hydroxyacyl-CoA dehydrogenase/enoyl-CoA hydratase family protein [Candidatus Thalassarchaeaceae archaeon]|tara:strand:+ start:322 stop:2661 length:2340 start_codon:yes stop_codon:yes gene_type:complete